MSYTEGDTVPAGKSVVTIGDSGEKCVAAEIPQEDIGGVELGQAVELQFVADPDNTISGRVVEKNLVLAVFISSIAFSIWPLSESIFSSLAESALICACRLSI